MTKGNLSIVLFTGTILCGCSTRNNNIKEAYFTDNAIVYDLPFQKADTLRGKELLYDLVGPYTMIVADSLICLPNVAQEPAFFVYDLAGNHLFDTGLHGQGPNDFQNQMPNGQVINNNGETSILVLDIGAATLKQLNLTKSLKKNTTVIDSIYPFNFLEKFAGLSHNRLVEEGIYDGNYELLIKSTDDYSLLHREKLYNIDAVERDPIVYWASTSISPDGQYLVMGMNCLNEINILNLQDFSRLTISIGNVKTYKEFCNRKNVIPDWRYYSFVSLAENNIYALYANEAWDPKDATETNPELHVFAYNGSLKLVAPFDRRIRSLSYAPVDGNIYALDFDDNVLRYTLPPLD